MGRFARQTQLFNVGSYNFAQAVLYESDLDDNGVSQCSVKLRVMPRAWLVLLRFFLRVDGSMVRLRETRLFCRCVRERHKQTCGMHWSEGE
jgi:hypothetical protein